MNGIAARFVRRLSRCGGARLTFWLVLLAAPKTAHAHLVSSGAGPFYDGVAHFLVSPDDLLVVITLALFGGLSGHKAAKWLVLMLPAAWMSGAVLGILLPAESIDGGQWIAGVSMLMTGLLLAANPRLPTPATAAVASVVGLVHGLLNGQAMATTNTSFLAAAGIVAALGLVTLLLSALAASLTVPWQQFAVRVIGSWVAAIGILALAWTFRPSA